MQTMNKRMFLTLAIGATLAGRLAMGSAFAATGGKPVHLRGTIDGFSGNTLRLTLRDGTKTSAVLNAQSHVSWILPAKASDIEKGSYIGTAAMPQKDGTLRALEIQVFPPSMRGVGEGFHPFDVAPHSTMTNGTIGAMTNGTVDSIISAKGRTLVVTYKGGKKTVFVPDGVPFITYAPADRSALTPGAHVIVLGLRAADGTVTARNVGVGKDGLVPPM